MIRPSTRGWCRLLIALHGCTLVCIDSGRILESRPHPVEANDSFWQRFTAEREERGDWAQSLHIATRDFAVDSKADAEWRGGIALTFDDWFVDEWLAASTALLEPLGVRATFFVSRDGGDRAVTEQARGRCPNSSENWWQSLRALEAAGHEIAHHTAGHLYASAALGWCSNDTLVQYLAQQVETWTDELVARGLRMPRSFAYPGGDPGVAGECRGMLEAALRQRFAVVRRTYAGSVLSEHHYLPPSSEPDMQPGALVFAAGTDVIYNLPLPLLGAAILRARIDNRVLVLYGHRIRQCPELWPMLYSENELGQSWMTDAEGWTTVDDSGEPRVTCYEALRKLAEIANALHVPFVTLAPS